MILSQKQAAALHESISLAARNGAYAQRLRSQWGTFVYVENRRNQISILPWGNAAIEVYPTIAAFAAAYGVTK